MPFMIGLSRMNPIRFLLFNGIGILLWAISVGFLGYGSGILMEAVLGEVKKYELLIPALIDATGAGVWLVYLGIQARAIRHDTRLWRI